MSMASCPREVRCCSAESPALQVWSSGVTQTDRRYHVPARHHSGGAGAVIAAVPYGSLILKEAPAKYFGAVASSRLTFGQFFYAMGIAISTIVIDKLTIGGTTAKLEAAGVSAQQVGTGLMRSPPCICQYNANHLTRQTSTCRCNRVPRFRLRHDDVHHRCARPDRRRRRLRIACTQATTLTTRRPNQSSTPPLPSAKADDA